MRQFCFDHGLLGKNISSVDDVAIRYPDGSVQGKPDRVRLRFETAYMEMAAQGQAVGRIQCLSVFNWCTPDPSRTSTVLLSWLLFSLGIGALLLRFAEAPPGESRGPRHADRLPDVPRHDRRRPEARRRRRCNRPPTMPRFASVSSPACSGRTPSPLRAASFYSIVLLIPAVLLGLHMGLFPYVGVFFLRFVLFFDKIVALSLLPILFIAFGIDELSKIMLIVIGVTPTIILDTFNLTKGVPNEQVVKAFTLGASDFDVAYRVVLRQIAAARTQQHSPEPESGHALSLRRRDDRLHRRSGLSASRCCAATWEWTSSFPTCSGSRCCCSSSISPCASLIANSIPGFRRHDLPWL